MLNNLTRRARFALLSGTAALALTTSLTMQGQAQDVELTPTFGMVQLTEGFGSHEITIQAGGLEDASTGGPDCAGFIATAPDFVVDYLGSGALEIAAFSEQDTTLLVADPAGNFICNDDFNEVNPQVTIEPSAEGFTTIWVGTFDPIENNTYPDAEIIVTEVASESVPPPPPTEDVAAPSVPAESMSSDVAALGQPTYGRLDLVAGESNGLELQAGGAVDAFGVNQDCAGFIAEMPDTIIGHPGGQLTIDVTSEADTTLYVSGPTGQVYCNDDNVDLNPGLQIANAPAGDYAVFVGTFEAIQNDFYPNASLTAAAASGGAVTPGFDNPRAQLPPAFGSTTLNTGFGNHVLELQAGGETNAFDLNDSCVGFIAEAPDYVVNLTDPSDLRITVQSDSDTTMVVIGPDGTITCNDDYLDLNPGVDLPGALAGGYAIWVGTFEQDGFPDATLRIEELKAGPRNSQSLQVSLTAGFEDDPFTTEVTAGGSMDASTLDGLCVGFLPSTPNMVLSYTAGDWPLRIYIVSDVDTTMAVRLPDGSYRCNDDYDGLNPSVALAAPQSGTYEVSIGTFEQSSDLASATLAVTELIDEKTLPPGAVTQLSVSSGLTRQDFDLLAGGAFPAADFAPDSCGGFVARAPDFTASVADNGIDLEMTVRSAEDTTLVVRTPSGQYVCDDDSGGDFNPLVTLSSAQAGTYQVWLGTFSAVGNAPATLSLRDINAASTPPPNVPGTGKK